MVLALGTVEPANTDSDVAANNNDIKIPFIVLPSGQSSDVNQSLATQLQRVEA